MRDAEIARRAAVVCHALAWVGTPYRHQASAIGQGTDCLGLVRGVWRHLYGAEPAAPPPYTPDWVERGPERGVREPLLEAATAHLVRKDGRQLLPGDVLLFRVARDGPVKHCGVYLGEDRFVHAYSGRAVTTSWLSRWWRERVAAVCAFPDPSE